MKTSATNHGTGGVATERFSDRLTTSMESRGGRLMRLTDMPTPVARRRQPMLKYLVHRSEKMGESEGRPATGILLAVHARLEDGIPALSTMSSS